MNSIYFKINGDDDTLKLDVDDDTFNCLKNSDAYAVQYIKNVINQGLIECQDELQHLWRSENNINFYPVLFEEAENVSKETLSELQPSTEIWNVQDTKFLLDRYEIYLNSVGPMKKFKTKKNMWQQISNDIHNILNIDRTPAQCENRYKTIIKRKKKSIDNNKTSGQTRLEIEYEQELTKIAAKDDSILPEVLAGVNRIQKRKIPPSDEKKENKKPAKGKSITEVLIEIHKNKEEAKERRHRERIEALKELGEMFLNRNEHK